MALHKLIDRDGDTWYQHPDGRDLYTHAASRKAALRDWSECPYLSNTAAEIERDLGPVVKKSLSYDKKPKGKTAVKLTADEAAELAALLCDVVRGSVLWNGGPLASVWEKVESHLDTTTRYYRVEHGAVTAGTE